MKKKGLIISTVVMVVVLIASLTTATYAWFTASSVTTIKGFDVSVVSNNAVNIGIKTDYTHSAGAENKVSPDAFVTGDLTFADATAGQYSTGTWSSTSPGLSAALNPNIVWGAQDSAFGILNPTESAKFTGDTYTTASSNIGDWTKTTLVTGALAVSGTKEGTTNVVVGKAEANHGAQSADGNGYANGDYVHFILGVSPTRELEANNFVIAVEPTGTASALGVLASIHVAYRLTTYGGTTTDWVDVDMYGEKNNGNTLKNAVTTNESGKGGVTFSTDLTNAYSASYEKKTPQQGSIALVITGLDTAKDSISQLEIVIYMSGTDPDCNDQGKTSQGSISMFFQTVDKTVTPQG